MEFISFIIDFIIHIDQHLKEIIAQFGAFTFIIIFIIIFLETGLIVTPFLPGDSLIFALGTFAAINAFNPLVMYLTVLLAAIIGDSVNYYIASKIGKQVIEKEKIKFIKKEHIDKTEAFFAKHGGKTIILARFVPFVRTFAPFVAGVSRMNYRYFITYNIIGAFLWVTLFYILGLFFGNIPFIQDNFSIILIAIIFISLLPSIVAKVVQDRKNKKNKE